MAQLVLKVLACIFRGESSKGQISLSPLNPLPLGFLKRMEKQIPRKNSTFPWPDGGGQGGGSGMSSRTGDQKQENLAREMPCVGGIFFPSFWREGMGGFTCERRLYRYYKNEMLPTVRLRVS